MRLLSLMIILLGCMVAPALADDTLDAKLRCQMEYGSGTESDLACVRGVDLAARAENELHAIRGCRDTSNAIRATACQRGVALRARVAGKGSGGGRTDNTSNFSYSWDNGRPAAQVEVGGYQARIGDAEKSIDECMRAYEGSSTPPSCLSGLKVQPKPPGAPPLGGDMR